jgi:hypothetical protein
VLGVFGWWGIEDFDAEMDIFFILYIPA